MTTQRPDTINSSPGTQETSNRPHSATLTPPKELEPSQNLKVSTREGKKDEKKSEKKDTGPTRIVALVMELVQELFHSPDGKTYAIQRHSDLHREVWELRSRTFNRWMGGLYFKRDGCAASQAEVAAALNLLEAKALYEGRKRPVHVRVAEHNGNIYLDLANDKWQAVRITPTGWHLVDFPPVLFVRPGPMRPLPMPEQGGTLSDLRQFLNIPDDNQFILILAWLVGSLNPSGPYPILVLEGDQGSGKSSMSRLLRSLVDANEAPLRSIPGDERDLMIAASNSWCSVFENVSVIRPAFSDCLCRLSTGGGYATRRLYTDDEEIVFNLKRPLILNGITVGIERADLADRCLFLTLPEIPPERRQSESDLQPKLERNKARILGALLGAVSCALNRLPGVTLEKLPRMADFAKWATAAEPTFGFATGSFSRAYDVNRREGHQLALDSSTIWPALQEIVDSGDFSGTPTKLLERVRGCSYGLAGGNTGLPKTAAALSGEIKRLTPSLASQGILVEKGQTSGSNSTRWIKISRRNAGQQPGAED